MRREAVSIVSGTIEVDVPVAEAYDRWIRFEDFRRFMEGVERVTRIDEGSLEWTARVDGRPLTWVARITELRPDHRVAWVSRGGGHLDATVELVPVHERRTQISLTMRFAAPDPVEIVGDQLSVVENRVQGDLARFKRLVEARGRETGPDRGPSGRSSEVT
jgi:uncharacterized membrane protein